MSEDPKNGSANDDPLIKPELVPYNSDNKKWCFGEKTVHAGGKDRVVHSTNNLLYHFALYKHIKLGGQMGEGAQDLYEAWASDMDKKYHFGDALERLESEHPDLYHDFSEDARDFLGDRFSDYRGPLWDSTDPRVRPLTDGEQEWCASQVFDAMVDITTELNPQLAVMSTPAADLRFLCA